MMNYSEFKETVVERFKEYLPKELQNENWQVNPVRKINRTLDGLSFTHKEETYHTSPVIYVNDMYEAYKKCNDLNLVLEDASKSFMAAMLDKDNIETITMASLTEGGVEEKIIFQLINTEQNKEMLADMPHREFADLSIIYRLVVQIDEHGMASSMIDNSIANRIGMSEDQMFKYAAENTKRILPPNIRSMNDVLRDLLRQDGAPEEIVEIMVEELPEDAQMYVVSNSRGIYGAVGMLYEDGFHDLAEKLGTDLYILPSSVHEVIAVSANIGNPDDLAEYVAEVNISEVSLDQRLSNQVYLYDKELRKITLVTDTPYKTLNTPDHVMLQMEG